MKITVDKALIEQAIEVLDDFHTDGYRRESCYEIMKALRAALANPVVEPSCKWPTCQTEKYQQDLADQLARELIGTPPAEVPLLTIREMCIAADKADEG